MQFKISHLLIAITLTASMIGLFRVSPPAAMLIGPVVIGCMTGFFVGRSTEAVLLGCFGSSVLVVAMSIFVAILFQISTALIHWNDTPEVLSASVGVASAVSSVIGGYYGGRLSLQ